MAKKKRKKGSSKSEKPIEAPETPVTPPVEPAAVPETPVEIDEGIETAKEASSTLQGLLKKVKDGTGFFKRKQEEETDMMPQLSHDKSKIVVTFALQALADFAMEDPKMRQRVIQVLEEFTQTGSPAIKNRASKLLRKLNN